jgi:hypothetical protein
MAVIKEMFHESYSAHGELGRKKAESRSSIMMTYIFGNSIIDINATSDAITNFNIKGSNKFAVECVRWERLFEDYQYARDDTPVINCVYILV